VARKSTISSIFSDSFELPKKSVQVKFSMDQAPVEKSEDTGPPSLAKSLLNLLNGPKDSVERLAFETDPMIVNQYQSVYRAKLKLLPDSLLKRLGIQDDLVAAIVRARETQMATFGRPRYDRFGTGYQIAVNPGVYKRLTEEQKLELDTRIQEANQKFWTCGDTDGVSKSDRMSFSQWLQMSTRNAVLLGRIATEIVYSNKLEGQKVFHHFRPVDAGTIYKATPQKSAADSVRENAVRMLKQIKGYDETKKESGIDEAKFADDAYAWIQVIDSRPVQAFTDDEMRVHNFYPVVDVELDGYPVTPLDTMISAVTTHINITTHNKIYFQTGRAARGMLIFKSDDVDESTLQRVKQQFNASINSVNNAWRMPVFAVGTNDEITWESIDNSSRDAEFQYLTDMNARVILSAFQMSPDELPGWAYLSRGTNNQSLSESNNEYRLEAARDQGIRPLITQFEEFINAVIFPLIDPNLAKLCRLRLIGLDALTQEKEAVQQQTEMPIHLTPNDVMRQVEKPLIAKKFGGDFLFNPQWQAIIDKYCYVDEIRSELFGLPPDPSFHYVRDPFWMQYQQLQMQAQQAQAAAQAPPDGGGDGGGGAPGGAPGAQPQTKEEQTQGDQPKDGGDKNSTGLAQSEKPGADLSRSLDQALAVLSKSEKQLPESKKRILAQHRNTVDHALKQMEADLEKLAKDVVSEADRHRRT